MKRRHLALLVALLAGACATRQPRNRDDEPARRARTWSQVDVSVLSSGSPLVSATVTFVLEDRGERFVISEPETHTLLTDEHGHASALLRCSRAEVVAWSVGYVLQKRDVKLEDEEVAVAFELVPENPPEGR